LTENLACDILNNRKNVRMLSETDLKIVEETVFLKERNILIETQQDVSEIVKDFVKFQLKALELPNKKYLMEKVADQVADLVLTQVQKISVQDLKLLLPLFDKFPTLKFQEERAERLRDKFSRFWRRIFVTPADAQEKFAGFRTRKVRGKLIRYPISIPGKPGGILETVPQSLRSRWLRLLAWFPKKHKELTEKTVYAATRVNLAASKIWNSIWYFKYPQFFLYQMSRKKDFRKWLEKQ